MFIMIMEINNVYKSNKLKITLWLHSVYTTSRLQGFSVYFLACQQPCARVNEIVHVSKNEGWKEWKEENE
jgi:hypothetical protein